MAPKANKQTKPRLGPKDKDYDESEIAADDFRRNWVSLQGYSHRNRHESIPANREDYGFNHLAISTPEDVIGNLIDPPTFKFPDEDTQKLYLACVRDELKLARDYILKEQELGLNPDRPNLHKEAPSLSLGQGPIKFDIYAQQRVRLVMEGEALLIKLNEEKCGKVDSELEEAMRDYWMYWTELRASLAWQMPGKNDEEKEKHAGDIIEMVLGRVVEE